LEGSGHTHARISTPAVRRGSVALADLHIWLRRIECAQVPLLPCAFAGLSLMGLHACDPSAAQLTLYATPVASLSPPHPPHPVPLSLLLVRAWLQYGWTPLHLSAENGHAAVASALVAAGASIDAKDKVRGR
jgi:hypothetical protein